MNHEPRYAIVTGAGSGIGRALAVRLARDGWQIALADVNLDGCQETLEQVGAAGGDGRVEALDVSQPDQWESLRERLQLDWPRLDLLVNNAGVGGSGEVGEFSLEDWHWMLGINLFGVVYGCHTMVDWLKANPRGAHIVNTASILSFYSIPASSAYNISKASVVSLSETMYLELAPHNVGVTVLLPTVVKTGIVESARFTTTKQQDAAVTFFDSATLTAEDVAEAAVEAVYRKRLYVVQDAKARWYWRLKRWLPGLFMHLMRSGVMKASTSPADSEDSSHETPDESSEAGNE